MHSPLRIAAVVVVGSIACTQGPSSPTTFARTSQTAASALSATEPEGSVTSTALAGSWTAGGITGEIRISPYPVQGDVPLGSVHVNLCHPPATGLRYGVDWGDGASERSGFCRFEHTYSKTGRFTLTVCVSDSPSALTGSCSTFEVTSTAATRPMTPGCYDSTTTIDLDLRLNGPLNQPANSTLFNSLDGTCTGGDAGFRAMEVYFEGTQADAFRYCQSLDPLMTYIENSQAAGYNVPSEYLWLCTDK
jgi:hypothetical protein